MSDTKRIEVTDDSYMNVDIKENSPAHKPEEKSEVKTERPEWLPEKFATAEDLAKRKDAIGIFVFFKMLQACIKPWYL